MFNCPFMLIHKKSDIYAAIVLEELFGRNAETTS